MKTWMCIGAMVIFAGLHGAPAIAEDDTARDVPEESSQAASSGGGETEAAAATPGTGGESEATAPAPASDGESQAAAPAPATDASESVAAAPLAPASADQVLSNQDDAAAPASSDAPPSAWQRVQDAVKNGIVDGAAGVSTATVASITVGPFNIGLVHEGDRTHTSGAFVTPGLGFNVEKCAVAPFDPEKNTGADVVTGASGTAYATSEFLGVSTLVNDRGVAACAGINVNTAPVGAGVRLTSERPF